MPRFGDVVGSGDGVINKPPPGAKDGSQHCNSQASDSITLMGKLEGNGPVEPAASRAIEDKHAVQ